MFSLWLSAIVLKLALLQSCVLTFIDVFKDFIYLFLDWGREGEREGKKHQCVVASCAPATGDLAHNSGMCPDWESSQRPFGSQASTQSTEPHQPGLPGTLNNEQEWNENCNLSSLL